MPPRVSHRIAAPALALLAALFAATACGSSPTTSTSPESTSASPSPSKALPDPTLTKALLDQASLPSGYTIVDPQTTAVGQAAAGAITNTSETTFTPAECGPATGKTTPDPGTSATLTATSASGATVSEAVAHGLYNFPELRANRAKCMSYTVTTKVMGVEASVQVTRTILDSPQTSADDLLVVEERSESTNPATAAPATSLVAYANAGNASIMLTSSALERPAFNDLLSTAINRARAAS